MTNYDQKISIDISFGFDVGLGTIILAIIVLGALYEIVKLFT